jgi:DNA invertase Pin-like site-specific DNA recombinase
MNEKKVAIYCRVACEDKNAIAFQESVVRNFADKNGFSGCICYCDNGVTARQTHE